MEKLLWVDIETTGLDEKRDLILEVGMAVTDENLEFLDGYSSVIMHKQSDFLTKMDNTVLKMHVNSDLVDEVRKSNQTGLNVEFEAKQFVKKHFDGSYKPALHGNTVHFDKRFIKYNFPSLDALFNYRIVDVSSLKIFMKRHFGLECPKEESKHRVMSDIEHSIREYKFYLDWIKANTIITSPVS
jgi:oligoribonuclease